MSNKMEDNGMTSTGKRALVPKLRFPKFRDAGEWENRLLDTIAIFYKGKGISKADIDPAGEISCIRYGELYTVYDEVIREVVSKTNLHSSELFFSQRNDVLIPSSGETKLDIAKAACVLFDDIALGGDLNVLRSDENGIFLSYLFNGSYKTEIAKKAQGDTVVHLYASQLKLLNVAIPKPAEQQKIADCLSSIDELITLETQKLNTLKTHKKGLVQQLFPAEGETLPKLRFPEFRDTGEWEERQLGDIGSVRMCKRIFKDQTSSSGDVPFYKIGTFGRVPDSYISWEIFENYKQNYPFPKTGSVLISASGTIGRAVIYKGELAYFQDSNIVWLDNDENLITDSFLFFLYQMINWAPSVGAIQRLYNENILGAKVGFPSIPEQQKIADCLASLDDLITIQTQKLDLLKGHKKGLMQQLFPIMDEVGT